MTLVSWYTSVVFSRIDQKYDYLDIIIDKYSRGQITTRELGLLMNITDTDLKNIDPRDTIVQHIMETGPNTLFFHFVAR